MWNTVGLVIIVIIANCRCCIEDVNIRMQSCVTHYTYAYMHTQ